MFRTILAAIAAAMLLAACSGGQNAGSQGSPAPALRNTIDFPLYSGATLISARSFTQVVKADTAPGGNSVFTNGNGTYTGTEIIASSNATFADLSAWVGRMNSSPPAPYRAAESGGDVQEHAQARRIGLDYAVFTKKDGAHTHGLLVLVMDPPLVNQRFGTVLGLISKYRSLPQIMRDPIDNEVKARIGMTISEATQPDSPVGAALSALDQFEHKDSRGIVLLDATKR